MKRLFVFMFSLPWAPLFIILSIILFWIVTYIIVEIVRPERVIEVEPVQEQIAIPVEPVPDQDSPFY